MNVDEYVESMKRTLENFRAYWKEGESRDPEHFPHEYPELYDWDYVFMNEWLENNS